MNKVILWLGNWVARIIFWACTRAKLVSAVAGALAIAATIYTFANFDISTDLDALLDAHLPWRIEARNLEHSFPDQGEDITVIVDGSTPELAEQAAARLTQELARHTNVFRSVERANGGPFFDREGLLYGATAEVRQSMQHLIAAQPFLSQVASDPSLRGLLASLDLALTNPALSVDARQGLNYAIDDIQSVIAWAPTAQPRYLSWRGLLGDHSEQASDWRQFIEILPRLDYSSSAPGRAATHTIRKAERLLHIDEAHGVRARITGSTPIADEELATLGESTGAVGIVMLVCMLAILYLATRSARAVGAMLATVGAGAAITSAFGLALLDRFNLVSIAFLPLFAGLGLDFCIQIHARARAERSTPELGKRLAAAGQGVGGGLTLAAAAIAIAFFSFIPTAYRGVSELGIVAGFGIVVAFVLCITLFPALLTLFGAPLENERELSMLRQGDRFLSRHRYLVLGLAALAALAALLALPRTVFDFDPMRLRNPHTEAVQAYFELASSAETTPNTVNLTANTLSEANTLAHRLQALPNVGAALTLASFVPTEQADKLTLITDAHTLLEFTLDPFVIAPPPSDAEMVAALRHTSANLRAYRGDDDERLELLASALDGLARAPAPYRARVEALLMQGLGTALSQISQSLSAGPVTMESLPPYLRRLWLSPSGQARVEVSPAKPLLDMAATERFVSAVRTIAPNASGDAVTVVESERTILGAFAFAGAISAAMIVGLLIAALRRWRRVLVAAVPIVLSGVLTFGICALMGLSINLENMIALPLLLGVGVAFNIYFVAAWQSQPPDLFQSSLSRGIFFSALTTGTSFSALTLSAHPGTASMGALLLIALAWIVVTSLFVSPALANVFSTQSEATPDR